MKKISRLTVIAAMVAAMIFGTAGTCFAALSVDYDSVYLNRDNSVYVNVTSTEGDIYYFTGKDGVNAEFGSGADSSKLYISTDKDATVGNHAIYVGEEGTGDSDIIQVFVIDDTAPVITSLAGTSKGITVRWGATDAGRYDVQYKASNGKWQTAAHFVKGNKYTVKGLSKGKKYSFRVRGVNYAYEWGEINGDWSKIKTKTY